MKMIHEIIIGTITGFFIYCLIVVLAIRYAMRVVHWEKEK